MRYEGMRLRGYQVIGYRNEVAGKLFQNPMPITCSPLNLIPVKTKNPPYGAGETVDLL